MRTAQIAGKAAGGYVLARSGQLMEMWARFQQGRIKLVDVRVYLACNEMLARRCMTRVRRFGLDEITRLTGTRRPAASVARLQAAGLLIFDEDDLALTPAPGHRVVFPRRMLRYVARFGHAAMIATVLGHLIRGFRFKNGACYNGGRCKTSDLSKIFGIDLRRVKAARAELVSMGWLVMEPRPQWSLNRHGAAYRFNLTWQGTPPPPAPEGPPTPPPDSDGNLPAGVKNQEPEMPGVSIHDVKEEDLKSTERTLELHDQAVRAGLVTSSEADQLRVVAAAEHALAVATTNAPGLFATILRKNLFGFLTQDDEDAARVRIRTHLFPTRSPGPEGQFRADPGRREPMVQDPDVILVREVIAAARRKGFKGDPFYALRQQDPTWTRDRWNAASGASPGGTSPATSPGPRQSAPESDGTSSAGRSSPG